MEYVAIITTLATVALAIFTWRYVVLTKRIVKSNEKINKELLRPYVIVYFIKDNHELYFCIKNIGKRIAKDLEIKINPDIEEIVSQTKDKGKKWINIKPILNHTVFPPDYEIKFL